MVRMATLATLVLILAGSCSGIPDVDVELEEHRAASQVVGTRDQTLQAWRFMAMLPSVSWSEFRPQAAFSCGRSMSVSRKLLCAIPSEPNQLQTRQLQVIPGLAQWAKTATSEEKLLLAQLTPAASSPAPQPVPTLKEVIGSTGTRRLT